MLGFPMYALKHSGKLRKKHRLPNRMQSGVVVIFGHQMIRRHRALRRRFAGVSYL